MNSFNFAMYGLIRTYSNVILSRSESIPIAVCFVGFAAAGINENYRRVGNSRVADTRAFRPHKNYEIINRYCQQLLIFGFFMYLFFETIRAVMYYMSR